MGHEKGEFRWDAEFFEAVDGARVAYRRAIPAAPSAIVLWIHAISHCSKIYALVAKQFFAYNVGISMIDMRGHGETPGKKGDLPTPGLLEADIERFLDNLSEQNPGTPIFLAGHSAGCLPVLRFFQHVPRKDYLRGAMLVVPAIDMNPWEMEYSVYDRKGSVFYYKMKYGRDKPNVAPFPEKFRKSFEFKVNLPVLLLARWVPFLRHRYLTTNEPEERYELRDQSPCTTYSYVKGMEIGAPHAHAFEALNVPALLVAAENDEIIDPVALQSIFFWNLAPGQEKAFFVQPGATHIDVVYRIVHKLVHWIQGELGTTSKAKAKAKAA